MEKPKKYSFELTRAEFLSHKTQDEKLGSKREGLVAIEKIAQSFPEVKLHYIGKDGIVNFIKKINKKK